MLLFEISMNSNNSGFLDSTIEGFKDAFNNSIFHNGNDTNISIITNDNNVNF